MRKAYLTSEFQVKPIKVNGADAEQWISTFPDKTSKGIPFIEKPDKLYKKFLKVKTDKQALSFMNKYGVHLVHKEFVDDKATFTVNGDYVWIGKKQFWTLQAEVRKIHEKLTQDKLEPEDIEFINRRAKKVEGEEIESSVYLGKDENAARERLKRISQKARGFSGDEKFQKLMEALNEEGLAPRQRMVRKLVDKYCLFYRELAEEICRTPLKETVGSYRKDKDYRNLERIRSKICHLSKNKPHLKKMWGLLKQFAQWRWFNKNSKGDEFPFKISCVKLADIQDKLKIQDDREFKVALEGVKNRRYLEYLFDNQCNLKYKFLI